MITRPERYWRYHRSPASGLLLQLGQHAGMVRKNQSQRGNVENLLSRIPIRNRTTGLSNCAVMRPGTTTFERFMHHPFVALPQ